MRFSWKFSGLHYCLFVKVLFILYYFSVVLFISDSFYRISFLSFSVKHFFQLFYFQLLSVFKPVIILLKVFFARLSDKTYLIISFCICQQEIVSFFHILYFYRKCLILTGFIGTQLCNPNQIVWIVYHFMDVNSKVQNCLNYHSSDINASDIT